MFIAHLPAGYLGACLLAPHETGAQRRERFWPFLIGSILPDVDMLYFYLIDRGRHLHHHYWTHLPIFWLSLLAGALVVAALIRSRRLAVTAGAFTGGVLLHLFLDTPFAGIPWLYPWSEQSFHWVTVPATRSWWVWSFVFHWSFLFEIAICLAAGVLYLRPRRSPAHHA